MSTETFEGWPGEMWRPIIDETHYQISNYGRVFSTARGSLKLLTPDADKTGTVRIRLPTGHKRLHNELAKAFLFNPHNDTQVVLVDGDKANVQLGNIQWRGLYRRDEAIQMLISELKGNNHKTANAVLHFMEGRERPLNELLERKYQNYKKIAFWEVLKLRDEAAAQSLAEDAVQSGMLKMLSALNRGLFYKPHNFDGWVAVIIRNAAKNIANLERRFTSIYATGRDGEEFNLVDAGLI